MGLIRKTFAFSAAAAGVPVVRMNSKKQRVARAQLNELRAQTELLQQGSSPSQEEAAALAKKVYEEHNGPMRRINAIYRMEKQGEISPALSAEARRIVHHLSFPS